MSLARRLPWMAQSWPRLQPLVKRGVHALLLYGARGIGKKNLAFDLADALLCAAPGPDGHACGRCDECVLNGAGNHPDLRVVLPQALADLLPQAEDEMEGMAAEESNGNSETNAKPARASREIRVEQIRALADFLNIATHRNGQRVVLLAPADALNAIAANTLLKMLEEPPPATVFVLVADALDDVLPTIRSRCVLVKIPLPERETCLQWLTEQGVADPVAALALAGGAPFEALAEAGPDVLAVDVTDSLYRLLEQGPALDAGQVAGSIGRDISVAGALRLLQRWAFDLLQYRANGQVRYHPSRERQIRRLAPSVRTDGLWLWINAIKKASAASEHPLNARLVLESVLIDYLEVFSEST